jgi:hypothetical protein
MDTECLDFGQRNVLLARRRCDYDNSRNDNLDYYMIACTIFLALEYTTISSGNNHATSQSCSCLSLSVIVSVHPQLLFDSNYNSDNSIYTTRFNASAP